MANGPAVGATISTAVRTAIIASVQARPKPTCAAMRVDGRVKRRPTSYFANLFKDRDPLQSRRHPRPKIASTVYPLEIPEISRGSPARYSQNATQRHSILSRIFASGMLLSKNAVWEQRQVTEWSLSWNLNNRVSSSSILEKYHQRCAGS